ncbi:MAG TPA: hypothetical protein VKA12_04640 [Roseiarcus sp.]|nr:hypothetical protein [Roseiarcus sp.]
MTLHPSNNPWEAALLQGNIIQGRHLKLAKGVWYLDDEAVTIGPNGLKITMLMSTALTGKLRWEGGVVADQDLWRYTTAPPPEKHAIPEGWDPFTGFLAIGQDDAHLGQLMTATSSAWNFRNAFKRDVISSYHLHGCGPLPIVTLGSRLKKNDPNGNFEPIFAPVDWADPSDFAGFLPEEPKQLAPPEEPPPIEADPNAGFDPDDLDRL